jgi:hypothetical protein
MKKILKKLLIIAAVLMIPVLLYGGYNQENVGGGIVGPYNANDCEKVNAQGQTVSAGGACGTSAAVYPGGNGIMTVSGGNSYGSVLPYTAFGASIFDAANASAALADLGAAASNAIRGDSIGSNTNKLLRVDGSNNVAPVTLDSNLILSSGGNLTLNVGTGANQIVQLNSSDKLPAVDGSLLTNFTAAQVAAFSWVQGGANPITGNVMIKGTGANISPSGWSLVGTNGGAYDLDLIGTGGNVTLTDSTNTISSVISASATAVKSANDNANGRLPSAGTGLVEQIVAIFDGGGSAIPLNSIAYVHRDYAISSINTWTVTCNAEDATPIVIDVYGQAYSASSLPTSTLCSTGTKPTGGGASAYGNQAAWNCSTMSSAANYDYAFKVTTAPSTSTWCVVTLKGMR